MARSARACSTEPRSGAPSRRRPSFAQDESAVSEVVGFIITFGIISGILVLSMVAFVGIQETVGESIVEQRARSASQRVAAVAVDASLFAETYGTETNFTHRLALPDAFEGRSYSVATEPEGGAIEDRVRVQVPSLGIDVHAVLFSAGAPADFSVCASSVDGGPLLVRFDEDPANPGSYCLFLETAP